MIFYHVSPIPDLTAVVPFKGRVYVTDADNLLHWYGWVRFKHDTPRPVYVYEVVVPDNARIGEGIDGARLGDYYVETRQPLSVRRQLTPSQVKRLMKQCRLRAS
jgi:hypothetical protein